MEIQKLKKGRNLYKDFTVRTGHVAVAARTWQSVAAQIEENAPQPQLFLTLLSAHIPLTQPRTRAPKHPWDRRTQPGLSRGLCSTNDAASSTDLRTLAACRIPALSAAAVTGIVSSLSIARTAKVRPAQWRNAQENEHVTHRTRRGCR